MAGLFEDDTPLVARAYARVALERGLEAPDGLTYAIPDDLMDLVLGDRVMVPLGRGDRPVSGIVLGIDPHPGFDPKRIKAILSRDRSSVRLSADLVELAQWLSRYYVCPLGMTLAAMLPAAVKRGTGLVKRTAVSLGAEVQPDTIEQTIADRHLRGLRAEALREVARQITAGESSIQVRTLTNAIGARTDTPIRGLIEQGLLEKSQQEVLDTSWAAPPTDAPPVLQLTDDQQKALDAIRSAPAGFGVHLLRGVTGSGKTEVYIRLIEEAVAQGRGAIVLVPEIALTPQTAGRFVERFEHVAILHSGLSAAQRHRQWSLIREGRAKVVVGARSAVFAPMDNLGLIVVDEEHDSSYKQDQAPRYHARDVAVKRAQLIDATVVLGSATPSLESWQNATTGRYQLIELPKRVLNLPMPKVHIIDLNQERQKRAALGSRGQHLLSVELERALTHTLDRGAQAMLLLNRRGFANFIGCPDANCGWVKTCEHCDVNMVYHKTEALPLGGLLRCHYCGLETLLPRQCPACAKRISIFGLGTQKVEDEIARKLPDARMLRMDSDTMRTAADYEQALDRFRKGEINLLIGTQMIAKGLDFPNVRLVGVISADTALSLPDFRASERTFQLVCQVAGRSGRSDGGGAVLVQTFTPDHPSVILAASHDFRAFAERELADRRAADLPPISRMARIVCRDENASRAEADAAKIAETLQAHADSPGIRILGPMPAPIARIGGFHRHQIEIIASDAGSLQRLLATVRQAGLLRSDARTAVDVDPVTLL